jgi:uncharacterized membrane protein
MAKKNFTDSLMGTNRSKKLDMLVSGGSNKADQPQQEKPAAKEKTEKKPAAKAEPKKETATASAQQTATSTQETPQPRKKRGRKKKDIEKDSFFYTVEKEFLFEVKAAAFWDRRDISEFISMALKHYMYAEMGESEIRRAVREYKKRLEEAI